MEAAREYLKSRWGLGAGRPFVEERLRTDQKRLVTIQLSILSYNPFGKFNAFKVSRELMSSFDDTRRIPRLSAGSVLFWLVLISFQLSLPFPLNFQICSGGVFALSHPTCLLIGVVFGYCQARSILSHDRRLN